ncbi:MAG: putative UvrB/UvrC domain protein [Firmicutes bacterium]|nr:putative UvrB/UvrC domain protein [Bacillota bacterium]
MLCDKCKKNDATYRITKIIYNKKVDLHLCEQCAREMGEVSQTFPIQNIISELMGYLTQPHEIEKQHEPRCSNCGTYYSEFKKGGLLGCSECYSSFGDALNPVLKRVQGSVKHVGKTPRSRRKARTNINELDGLQIMLQKAIENEEYEEAAKIRDEIKKMQNSI